MTRTDKLLAILLIISSVVALLWLNMFVYADMGNEIIVEVDGKQYGKYQFSSTNSSQYIEIDTKNGYNILEITKNGVRVSDASCPDKLDVKQGFISGKNQLIVCIPNKMVVYITGNGGGVDAVTY